MTHELPEHYEDRPIETARVLSGLLEHQLTELVAETVVLSRDEATAALGLINAVIEAMEMNRSRPN